MNFKPKSARFQEFIRRLDGLPSAGGHDEARQQIDGTLNEVEDAMSGVPFDPSNWRTDGRMYPAQDDAAADVPSFPRVTSYRHRAHETFIAENGAFEIHDMDGRVLIAKRGSDGKGVWE